MEVASKLTTEVCGDGQYVMNELALRVPNPAASPAIHNRTASQFDTSTTTKVCI
jgi:hypothetical protein